MLSDKMRPYEFMVYPTLQTAWIRGKGILLFAGLFLVELGAGLFVASSILGSLWGQTAGWLMSGALGGGCHFLFLGHPFRIYRAMRRPGKSWISRGLIIISLFQLFGCIHLVLSYLSTPVPWVMVAANVLAVTTILYGGYEIADVKSIPTWHSSFLPIQMLARSFFIGLAVVLVINLLLGRETAGIHTSQWLLVTLLINICLFVLSLVSLAFEEGKKKLSLSMMAKGDLKRIFWPWVVAGGMIIPLLVVGYGALVGAGEIGPAIWLIAVILQVIGDPLLRYGLMRTGYYPGIFPGTPSDFR
ncbi:MAG: DmsC/YnfH family molybdoenzyme membrane anchor subunit [Thermodesulfobacteriota bacterium]